MDEDARREILTAVAEGRMTPDEAAARLAGHASARAGERPDNGNGNGNHDDDQPIRRVRVQGTFRSARIIGDSGVREAVAEGPHAARREGDTLVIESERDLPGFSFQYGHRARRGGFTFPFGDFDPGWWRSGDEGFPPHLTVRMHPDLALAVDLTAGRIVTDGMRGPLRVNVTAGGAELKSLRGPLDIKVAAGSVRAAGVLSHGHSRVRCEAGSVKLHLERGSDVRIHTKADLGRVSLPNRSRAEGWLTGGVEEDMTIGEGAATLDVEVAMGEVAVTAD